MSREKEHSIIDKGSGGEKRSDLNQIKKRGTEEVGMSCGNHRGRVPQTQPVQSLGYTAASSQSLASQ